MPIFEYQCQACGHQFDVLQKAGAGPLRKCPECSALKLRKRLSAPSFHLKGSGWYKAAASNKDAPSDTARADTSGSDGGAGKADAADKPAKPGKKGHTLDSGPAHSHDDHGSGGPKHSHGPHSHTHGPGCKHDHKH
jgi:putative FmdB family regulatory protein